MHRGKWTISKGQSKVKEEEEECERKVEHSASAGSCHKVNEGERRTAAPQVLLVLYHAANSNSPSSLAIRCSEFLYSIYIFKTSSECVKNSKKSC